MKTLQLSKLLIIIGIMSNLLLAEVGINLSGKSTIFYQTRSNTDMSIFDQNASDGNILLQINSDLNLGNDFTAKIQGTFLGTLGFEKDIISRQVSNINAGKLNDIFINQVYIKKVFDTTTTLKIGRMNISKNISPFLYSEGWTPIKNSLDAIILSDKTIPKTTLIGGYISQGNSHSTLSSFNDILKSSKGTFLFTLKNEAVSFLPISYSYYSVNGIDTDDNKSTIPDGNIIQIHMLSTKITSQDFSSLALSLQGGQIMPDVKNTEDTIFYGLKLSYKMEIFSFCASYTDVDNGNVNVSNMIGVKSPLYTQMLLNQDYIRKDSKTFVLKAIVSSPIVGKDKIIAQYGQSTLGDTQDNNDFKEFDLIYKAKIANINIFTGYAWTQLDSEDARHFIRIWGKYSF